ncbi:MAG: HlyD family efflux transporter periplasmic adaptor subunit [Planctomycetales bacterium]|nr:HlyD family efflux transporter periplasmic adaptor subunit [Planctomycetales bacterium]
MRKLTFLAMCLTLAGAAQISRAAEPGVIEGFYLVAIQDVRVPATDAGMLVSIEVEEGDVIEEGQLLARVDDREATMAKTVAEYEYRAAKKQAENEISVEAAVKSEEVSKAEYDAATEANRKVPGSFGETEVRRLDLTWKRSGLQKELAIYENEIAAATAWAKLAQVKQAETMIERRKLTAPHSGIVVEKLRQKGEWVAPGDPVAHIVRMDELRLIVRVDANEYYYKDLEGRPVEVTVMMPGGRTQVVNAKIGFASPVVEEDGAFRAWVNVPNQRDGKGWLMGPGLPATLKLR